MRCCGIFMLKINVGYLDFLFLSCTKKSEFCLINSANVSDNFAGN